MFLSQEKIFENFADLLLCAKIFVNTVSFTDLNSPFVLWCSVHARMFSYSSLFLVAHLSLFTPSLPLPSLPHSFLSPSPLTPSLPHSLTHSQDDEGLEVALKIDRLDSKKLSPDTATKSYIEVRAEVSHLHKLKHPHVIDFIGVVLQPLCFILEWACGGSLHSLLTKYRKVDARIGPKALQEAAVQAREGGREGGRKEGREGGRERGRKGIIPVWAGK